MKTILIAVMAMTLAPLASATTIVLDPGPGTDYLGVWCGGQAVSEYAQGFDAANHAVATVKVTTSCHGSGRGALNHYYIACWAVTFFPNGAILSRTPINSGNWLQGHPAVSCNVSLDPAAVFVSEDANGAVLATLSTTLAGTVDRAMLETAAASDTDPPTVTIDTPGDGTVYTLSQIALASYACSDPDGAFSCSGPVPDGSPIDTSSLGSHVFTVAAQDSLGNAGSLTHTYQVATACSNGADDDGDGLIDFDGGASANHGIAVGLPDPQCTTPDDDTEGPNSCGLGAEPALVLPLLAAWRRLRRRAVA